MTAQKNSPTLTQSSIKNGLILGLFALLSTALIGITHLVTKDKIALEIEAAMARQLNQVIPANEYDNDVYHDCALVSDVELLGTNSSRVYRMRNQNNDYALFMTSVAPDGYAGIIKLVIGIYKNGEIAGVRVAEHQETPGLGDKIEVEKSNWIQQFEAKSLLNTAKQNWLVKKDGGHFDALTGATITPRAIVKAVYKVLVYHQKNKTQLYSKKSQCGEKE